MSGHVWLSCKTSRFVLMLLPRIKMALQILHFGYKKKETKKRCEFQNFAPNHVQILWCFDIL
jgi:hypothetical protein